MMINWLEQDTYCVIEVLLGGKVHVILIYSLIPNRKIMQYLCREIFRVALSAAIGYDLHFFQEHLII